MNVDFILLGSILTKRNYDSNILRYQKNIFKKFVKLCLFSTINALKRHFPHFSASPFSHFAVPEAHYLFYFSVI